jgi:hypothetical protein
VGLLQDPHDDLGRQGVRSAGPGVRDGEEVRV